MKNKILFALTITLLLVSCKKKTVEPIPEPAKKLTLIQTIGSVGTSLSEFNFSFVGHLATDENFLYVSDTENHCIKKIDLSTNSIVGCYGFENGVWGYYTSTIQHPKLSFFPVGLIFKTNKLYVFSSSNNYADAGYTSDYRTKMYSFDITGGSSVDSSRMIKEWVYSTSLDIDNKGTIISFDDNFFSVYNMNGSVMKYGGLGTTDGKFNSVGSQNLAKIVNDTIVILDGGNHRIQKFTTSGSFISKFSIPEYTYCIFIKDNIYSFFSSQKYIGYTSNGLEMFEYKEAEEVIVGSNFIVVNDKVIVQDVAKNKLFVYKK